MAEKKSVGHAYNIDFLNVVFAACSVFLLLSVIWMVWDDYDREWKNTQRRFNQLEMQVTQAQLQEMQLRYDAVITGVMHTWFPTGGPGDGDPAPPDDVPTEPPT